MNPDMELLGIGVPFSTGPEAATRRASKVLPEFPTCVKVCFESLYLGLLLLEDRK